ncbi:MAG: hypothetical protein LH473_07905 [Chitinophagales bacterium]|nr:hypothetical protein [Chitinophagales bacterium]
MVHIFIIHHLLTYIGGIKAMLHETAITVAGEATSFENIIELLKSKTPHVLLISERLTGIAETLIALGNLLPDMKILLLVEAYTQEHLHKMVEWGAHHAIHEAANKNELIQNIIALHNDTEHLPHDAQKIVNDIRRKQLAMHC